MYHLVQKRLPLVLFIIAIALAMFAYGAAVGHYKVFPSGAIRDGVKTARILLSRYEIQTLIKFSHVSLDMMQRIEFVAGNELATPVLWTGGLFQFMEYCPQDGCLAVEYTRSGEVAHAYPLRLDELEKAASAGAMQEFPYEFSLTFSFRDTYPHGISRYANGDLLVAFMHGNAFPYGAGVARIDRDGHVLWYRRDYSHHWPTLLDDGTAPVPSLRIGREPFSIPTGTLKYRIPDCNNPYREMVHIIDGDGRLLKTIDLIDSLLASPYAPILNYTLTNKQQMCDLLHLNFIHQLGDDADGTWGIAPGDLVVSLLGLSAFAILDRESGSVKRLVRGNFYGQHSVQHLQGPTFLMFDNWGQDEVGGPSRLLMVDLADGRETTIFPNPRTPESLCCLITNARGYLDISADRKRALVTFTEEGVSLEVRLSDGEVLNIFRSLHDISDLDQFPDERKTKAALFPIYEIDYSTNEQ